MTKEEKIKESYGEYWQLIQPDVDENGWVAHWNHILRNEIQNHCELETMTYGIGTSWRPKSLKGIETNNGWLSWHTLVSTKTDIDYLVYTDKGNIYTFFMYSTFHSKNETEKITHCQPIPKPNPPTHDL